MGASRRLRWEGSATKRRSRGSCAFATARTEKHGSTEICGANCTWHTWICPLCEKLPVCGLAGCSWSSDSPCEQAMSGRKCTTRTRRRYAFSGCNMSCASISLLYAQKKPLPRAFSDGRPHVQMLACEWRCGRIPADCPRCNQRKSLKIPA